MESQQIQNIFLDYNKLFKPIKKGIHIKLESQTTIFPTKLEYPILYYLIDRLEPKPPAFTPSRSTCTKPGKAQRSK